MTAVATKTNGQAAVGGGRIAILHHELTGGGIGRVLVNLSAGLAELGCEVDLVLVRAGGPYMSHVHDQVRVVDLKTRRTAQSVPALVRYLRRERPAAVLSNIVHVNVMAAVARRLAGVDTRLVVAEHNHMSSTRRAEPYRQVRIAYRLAPWVYRFADRVVVVSEGIADDAAPYLRMPRERVEVIYNPVVSPTLADAAAEAVDHPWFAPGEPPVLLNVGRMVEQKDQATLLQAFAELRRRRQARLIILGEGPLRGELERSTKKLGIAEDVEMPGFVSNPYAYMAKAGTFVLSSLWEGLPTVLIEAMACGTPAVATACPSGPEEILLGGELGPLVPCSDPAALAAGMERVLDAPPALDRLRQRAAEFSIERGAAHYRRVLLE